MLKIRRVLLCALIIFIGLLLILRKEAVSEGIADGFLLCVNSLVPSLFPFMLLSSFAMNIFSAGLGRNFFTGLFERITALPSECIVCVFFSFIAGYPAGAVMINNLRERGVITCSQSERMFMFCINAGPAFVLFVVGEGVFGSLGAGLVILLSTYIASLVCFVAGRFIYKNENNTVYIKHKELPTENISVSRALVSAVETVSQNMINMCAWVIGFSGFSAVFYGTFPHNIISDFLCIFAEVTTGVALAAEYAGVPLASACVSFAGLCVMCQILPYIKKCGMKISKYLLFRIVNSLLACITAKIIMIFCDLPVDAFSYTKTEITSFSFSSSVMLIVMCCVFIYEVCEKIFITSD